MVRLTDRHDMTITIDWDVIPQTKQKHFEVHAFVDILFTLLLNSVG